MSGLEILGAVASSIALTAQQQLLGSAEHPLVSLATEELEDILKELNKIVERYSHSRKVHDPKRYTDKMKWFTEASKIEELRDRAQATKSNLHMAITFRVSSMIDRGNMRQEVLFHRVTQQLTSYTHESVNVKSPLSGHNDTSSSTVHQPRIQELDDQGVVISSELQTGQTKTQETSLNGPKLNLSLRPRRVLGVLGQEATVFSMLQHPSALQEHLRKGYKYFPDDVDPVGVSLLEYSISRSCWNSVEILLKLWKNILPYQGLPRFMREYNNYEEHLDILDIILERLSSLIPDWDEDHTTDIHLEAVNPEVTADGMLKALQKEPWAIDEQDERGMCPIHHAVNEGNAQALVLLIMAGANINQPCGVGWTPLLWSVSGQQEEVTKTLLEYEDCRVHVNDLSPDGQNALNHAIYHSFPAGVRMLFEAGATAKLPNTTINTIPTLHVLGTYSKIDQKTVDEIADLLLMHGADLEARDHASRTPIMLAITRRNILALRKFVSAGASLTAMSSMNHNILHNAAFGADVEILDYIAKLDLAGVQVTQRATDGNNPLQILYYMSARPLWRVTKDEPQLSSAAVEAFITFYFELLIPELRRHVSTIDELLQAVEDRDASTATSMLDQLVEKNVKCGEPYLAGWYRGLKGYVFGGNWDHLTDALNEENDETCEKIERARIARGKTITDPEMEEFLWGNDMES
ncbi:ankyrin repeat-containing domain protein [Fusarium flagelliforme]|uniref:ankyrin repeat-containing domain protein n=1 Tax=Fusarium flagelliforme TaxID=2675880 RepID=UPI001E8D36DF|nr:ankyrin repeat-containing domain protein [Fusarium flagelliforme]KAH7191883.1 ankyrin repeat-containing domain protein [Fusarium flagelliforme]